MGAEVPGHPAGAQPYEGNCEKPDSSLHGYLSTANRVPIHGRGVSLPPPSKIQNAASRGVRRNEGPSRPPQHLQEPDGVTWIPRPNAISSLRNHTSSTNFRYPRSCPSESSPSPSSPTSLELGHIGSRAITY